MKDRQNENENENETELLGVKGGNRVEGWRNGFSAYINVFLVIEKG